MTIKWPKGSHMQNFRKHVQDNLDTILTGTILAIDPGSVRLGYAVANKGEIVDHGTIELDQRASINNRLQDIVNTLQKDKSYDILAVEMIRGQMAHVFLKFSVGAVMGGAKAPVCIEVPIHAWKAVAGKEHKKTDADDAFQIANTLITLAKELKE